MKPLTLYPHEIRRRFDTLGPDPWAWATTLTRKDEG